MRANPAKLLALVDRLERAERALIRSGFVDNGAAEWKPPIGPVCAAELAHWKANHADMVKRCAFLSERDDLPVDRIPAYARMTANIAAKDSRIAEQAAEIARLTERAAIQPAGDAVAPLWRYGFSDQNFGIMPNGPYVLYEQAFPAEKSGKALTKEWCMRMAAMEVDSDCNIGAGSPAAATMPAAPVGTLLYAHAQPVQAAAPASGSIGDDVAFCDLITEIVDATEELSHFRPEAWKNLVAYIDARTASQPVQADDDLRMAGRDAANKDWRKIMKDNQHYRERVFNQIVELDTAAGLSRFTRVAPTGTQPVQADAPHILEALSYHARERDDLTLEDAVEAFRFGWKRVPGRTERAFLAQIIHLLASRPAAPEPVQADALDGRAPVASAPTLTDAEISEISQRFYQRSDEGYTYFQGVSFARAIIARVQAGGEG